MSLRSLLTQTATIVTPGVTTDAYNNTVDDWTSATRVQQPALIQQAPHSTEDQVDRDTVVTEYPLFLLPDAVITAACRVEEGGRTFEVIGQPDLLSRRGVPHHIEATLRLVAG